MRKTGDNRIRGATYTVEVDAKALNGALNPLLEWVAYGLRVSVVVSSRVSPTNPYRWELVCLRLFPSVGLLVRSEWDVVTQLTKGRARAGFWQVLRFYGGPESMGGL